MRGGNSMDLTHGTLVIGGQGNNFVVLAADSKGTLGDLLGPIVIGSSRAKKIKIISDHAAAAIYGIAEYGENLLREYQDTKKPDTDGVTKVLEDMRKFCKKKWREWFSGMDIENQPCLGFMVAGLDQDENGEYSIPRIYSIESTLDFAPALHPYGYACRGILSLATFIMDEKYEENMSIDDLGKLVESTISTVAQTDPRIGLPVRIALITPKEGARMIHE
jgi:20S proteasome alpha/beta subunit